jgi:DNA helicase IV
LSATTDQHPDFESEQDFLTHADECLRQMRDAVAAPSDAGGDPKANVALNKQRRDMFARFDSPDELIVGRINTTDGKQYYLGRQGISDGGAFIVINWAAPVVEPFYEATSDEPLGLSLRRRLSTRREELIGIADEWFGTDAIEPTLDDLLLDELSRERTSAMRQIAATIKADQYRIIALPLEATTIVQGGPGTGKTVVGLHRAALLLYRHRDRIGARRVLVVGPNEVFMEYISYVLPSLGETTVDQLAVDALVDREDLHLDASRSLVVEDSLVAKVKGDERMAEVLVRAVSDRVRPPEDDQEFSHNGIKFSVSAEAVGGLIGEFDPRIQPYNRARAQFRGAFGAAVTDAYLAEFGRRRPGEVPTAFPITGPGLFDQALTRIWPTMTAQELTRQFLSSRDRIERAAEGLLTVSERALIYRDPVERLDQVRWTRSDVALVDEVQQLIESSIQRYGHVILDEAQDLTPMQLRMVGRRILDGAVTVLGDLAQGTGLWNYANWDEVATHLGVDQTAEIEELTYAYRVPSEIMEIALPVLRLTAPSIKPPVAYRPGGEAPEFVSTSRADRAQEAMARAAAARERGGTTAVIAPVSLIEDVRRRLESEGVEFGDAAQGELSATVELLDPTASKGLEFDHVVVLEPAAIIRETDGILGQRDLYVALTRATRTLTCVHAEPLPWPLDDSAVAPATPLRLVPSEDGSGVESTELEPAVEPEPYESGPATEPEPPLPLTVSVDEALVLASLRGVDRDVAFARALAASAAGASGAEIAAAILDPSKVDAAAVEALVRKSQSAADLPEDD